MKFPGGLAPDYFDFLYYADMAGMTSHSISTSSVYFVGFVSRTLVLSPFSPSRSRMMWRWNQVTDVPVRLREIRHYTLVPSVLSFGFNMLILALNINVVAGLL